MLRTSAFKRGVKLGFLRSFLLGFTAITNKLVGLGGASHVLESIQYYFNGKSQNRPLTNDIDMDCIDTVILKGFSTKNPKSSSTKAGRMTMDSWSFLIIYSLIHKLNRVSFFVNLDISQSDAFNDLWRRPKKAGARLRNISLVSSI